MLSYYPDLKTLRLVCKALTGRTSSTAVARINRTLASYREEYSVCLGDVSTRRLGGADVVTLQFQAVNPSGEVLYRESVNLPVSHQDLVVTITHLDSQAEAALGLNYGGLTRARVGRTQPDLDRAFRIGTWTTNRVTSHT